MSASREWTEWHLTPDGWVAGAFKTDSDAADVPAPPNTVLSFCYEEYLAAMGESWQQTCQEIFRCPDSAKDAARNDRRSSRIVCSVETSRGNTSNRTSDPMHVERIPIIRETVVA
jgi:hypothetical protein